MTRNKGSVLGASDLYDRIPLPFRALLVGSVLGEFLLLRITQTGTNDPTVTEIVNTISDATLTASRGSTGVYTVTLGTNIFPRLEEVFPFMSLDDDASFTSIQIGATADGLSIENRAFVTGSLADGFSGYILVTRVQKNSRIMVGDTERGVDGAQHSARSMMKSTILGDVYLARVTQSSTDPPVFEEYINTMGITPTANYDAAGRYTLATGIPNYFIDTYGGIQDLVIFVSSDPAGVSLVRGHIQAAGISFNSMALADGTTGVDNVLNGVVLVLALNPALVDIFAELPEDVQTFEEIYDAVSLPQRELAKALLFGDVYRGSFIQTSTNPPQVFSVQNTLGADPVASYDGVGDYSISFGTDFILNKYGSNVFLLVDSWGDNGTTRSKLLMGRVTNDGFHFTYRVIATGAATDVVSFSVLFIGNPS